MPEIKDNDTTMKMMLVEVALNELWRRLPEHPKYKDFNKQFAVTKKENVKSILDFEKSFNKLHLSSKTTNKKVVYSFLTLIATITDILVDVPLAAIVDGDIEKDGRILGWTFYREEQAEFGPALGIKKKETDSAA